MLCFLFGMLKDQSYRGYVNCKNAFEQMSAQNRGS